MSKGLSTSCEGVVAEIDGDGDSTTDGIREWLGVDLSCVGAGADMAFGSQV